jgi:hypothetical protein
MGLMQKGVASVTKMQARMIEQQHHQYSEGLRDLSQCNNL